MRQLGPYLLEDEIARGGAGVVYRGRDAEGRGVAVKVMLGGVSEKRRERFQREVEALTRLRHDHIVSIRDAGEEEGNCYLVMELVAGQSLQEVIDHEGPLPEEEAARIVLRLAEAMQHAHEQNVLHRDLAPKNVIIDPAREPRLTDFGLTRDVEREGSSALSRTGVFMGTPGYWAPEQARGDHAAIGPRSDVYGLGATLYCMLTGRPPHEGSSLLEVMAAQDEPPRRPGELRPGLDRRLEAICQRCLRARPSDRYAGAAELAQALRVYLEAGEASGSRRGRWVGLAALILTSLGVGAFVLQRGTTGAEAPSQGKDAATLCAEAEAHLLSGEWEDAVRKAGQVLASEPERVEAYLVRAEARYRQAGWESRDARSAALIDLERAASVRPGDPRTRALRLFLEFEPFVGEWLVYRGRDSEGVRTEAEAILAEDPDQGLAWLVLEALTPRPQRQLGLEHLDRAAASPRSELDARLRRIVRRGANGPECVADVEAVLSLTAGKPGLVRARAYAITYKALMARLLRNDPQEASALLEEALRLIPGDPVALFHRAELKRAQGDQAGALVDFLETMQGDRLLADFFVKAVEVRFEIGDPSPADLEDCLADLDQAERLCREGKGYTPMSEIEFLRARCTFRLGRRRLAKELLRRVKVLAKRQDEANQMLQSPD